MPTEIWVCAACRSVNKIRAKACYRCRTPRDRGGVDASTIDMAQPGKLREIALPEYQSPRIVAVVATLVIVAAAVAQIAVTAMLVGIHFYVAEHPEVLEVLPPPSPPFLDLNTGLAITIAQIGLALLGLTCWALWLSLAVRAMPALGLGYPAATGTSAFLENFYPIVNVFRVPAIVRDLVRRLHPELGRGDALIMLALLGLLGSLFIPRIGFFLRLSANSAVEVHRNLVVLQVLAVIPLTFGVFFLVVLMWWLDLEIGRRRRLQLREPQAVAARFVQEPEPPRGNQETAAAGALELPSRVTPAPAPSPKQRFENEPLVGMPPIRALGITDAGAGLPPDGQTERD